ncbi:ABC transporter permease [Clostridium combesii]|uniref:Peptide ABC transporter permease n=1 Tax=Clostridium combesii TaxID=39481 RepID=A0A2G7HDQ7_9CLOT|nr:ABC transporter permease [Clostridium combesii]PIH03247.1 peptide ABC transporter permease [Clostridium combesii]
MNSRFLKILEYVVTVVIILTLNFFIPRLMPGDPFVILSGDTGTEISAYSEEQIERYKSYYGLDKPLGNQYLDYMKNLCKGDLGYSIYYNDMVKNIVKARFKWTFMLVLSSIFISFILGTIIGTLSAFNQNKGLDKILYGFFMTLSEIPGFLLGIVFLFILAGKLNLFPLSGAVTEFKNYNSSGEKFLDIIYHAALPIITLTISKLGEFYLIARSSAVSVISKEYIKTAKGKGLGKKTVIFKHILRNSILPIITKVFLSLGSIVGGSILVENVFNYPGLGKLMKEAVCVRDYPLIQGIFLIVTFMVIFMNLISDMFYKKLDPRVR